MLWSLMGSQKRTLFVDHPTSVENATYLSLSLLCRSSGSDIALHDTRVCVIASPSLCEPHRGSEVLKKVCRLSYSNSPGLELGSLLP